ncbi:MAG: 3-deoxy-7-phosphoheptulonate synthase [Planctomycetota bacterium]
MSKSKSSSNGKPLADIHVSGFEPLASPDAVKDKLPADEAVLETVVNAREALRQALAGKDPRLVMIVGPCSVHDPAAALEYAERLAKLRAELADKLVIVMRVYFEKPRTTVGWKGLINDPHVDGSHDINAGLLTARGLLLKINAMGLPCATEFLDPIVPQYTADLVTWAAIGARTIESQTHREMASGLSMPVGFKNPTDGSLQSALNAMTSSRQPHVFVGIDGSGATCIVRTSGNSDVHLVLRGGTRGANYSSPEVAAAKAALEAGPRERRILIDCGHGQTGKDYRKVPAVFGEVLAQWRNGQTAILGMMLESNLVAGKQALGEGLTYGQSITDACIDWDTTDQLLRDAAS